MIKSILRVIGKKSSTLLGAPKHQEDHLEDHAQLPWSLVSSRRALEEAPDNDEEKFN